MFEHTAVQDDYWLWKIHRFLNDFFCRMRLIGNVGEMGGNEE